MTWQIIALLGMLVIAGIFLFLAYCLACNDIDEEDK